MPRRSKVNSDDSFARAILSVAEKKGYGALTPVEIAHVLEWPVRSVQDYAQTPAECAGFIWRWVDKAVPIPEFEERGNLHDYLFDVLMTRIDYLQEQRAGFIALMDGIIRDPKAIALLAPLCYATMHQLARMADMGENLSFFANTAGLIAVYAATLRVWKKDPSTDMAATMAELDKRLHQMAAVCGVLNTTSRKNAA